MVRGREYKHEIQSYIKNGWSNKVTRKLDSNVLSTAIQNKIKIHNKW
jgi:hypothetical protein